MGRIALLAGVALGVFGLAQLALTSTTIRGTVGSLTVTPQSGGGAQITATRSRSVTVTLDASGVQQLRDALDQPPPPPPPSGQARPFAADSAWNTLIPASPALDASSGAMAIQLAYGSHVADIYAFGVPVYQATSSTPRYSIRVTQPWGPNPFPNGAPIPGGAAPSSGSDAAMVIVDQAASLVYEFWQYAWNGGSPSTSWGGVTRLDGPGTPAAGTGAGTSRLAGLVRIAELEAGVIPHALVFSSDSSCRSVYRYPASKTDGSNMSGAATCIPEGARVQLDPAVDVDAIPGITLAEKAVAKALQQYGAFNIDNGGARMALIFETPRGADPYPGLGFGQDYAAMPHIPWNRLRVLRAWDGT